MLQRSKKTISQCFIFCHGKSVINKKQMLRNVSAHLVCFLLNKLQTGFFINLWVCINHLF